MPTRFYFHGNVYVPGITPAYDSEWDRTVNAVRRLLSTGKLNSVNSTSSDSESSSSSPFDILNRQLISKPLKAQTISGTVKGQLRTYESNAAADMCRALIIKVVSGDGSTVRGTLLSMFPASLTSEYATSLTNRYFPPETSLNPVDAQEGDVIVIEIGTRAFNTDTTTYTSYWHILDAQGTGDLPEDETTTDALCPWIEFSQTLQFQDNVNVYQAAAQVEYISYSRINVTHNIVQVEYVPASGPVLEGNLEVSLSPTSQMTLGGLELEGAVTISCSPTSALDCSISLTGEAPLSLLPASEAALSLVEVEGITGLSLIPGSEIWQTLLVLDGEIGIGFTPSGILMASHELEGALVLEIQVAGVREMPVAELIGQVGFSMSVEHLEVLMALGGGLAAGGEPNYQVLGPDIHLVEMAGGLLVGGALETEIPQPRTYALAVKGGLAIGNGTKVEVFDPRTLAAVTLSLAGGAAVGGSLAAEAQYVSAEDLILAIGLKGGVKVGELRRPPIETTAPGESEAEVLLVVLRGGPAVGGDLQFAEQETVIFEFAVSHGGVRAGGGCVFLFLVPPVFETELYGGVTLGGGLWEDDSGTTETWVLCGYAMSPALFTNFDFNSYCQYRHQFYGAKKDGIYLLEGDSDDGRPIFSGIRIGPTNLGVDNLKRLRAVYPGAAGNPELRVKGEQGGQEAFYPLGRTNRFDCGREVEDRVLTLDIQDFDEISHLEIIPLILSQR